MERLCDPDWIKTNDLLLRRQLLYSTELPDPIIKEAQRYFFLACGQSKRDGCKDRSQLERNIKR